MRVLKINNIIVDIDENTSIGIDIQCYDIKNPAKRKMNVSNNFSLPKTTKNLELLYFPGSPFFGSPINFYSNKLTVKYYIQNVLLVDGYVRVDKITNERIYMIIHSTKDIWDDLKKSPWLDLNDYSNSFTYKYLRWAGLPIPDDKATYDDSGGLGFAGFITDYVNNTYIKSPSFNSNFFNVTNGSVSGTPALAEDVKNKTFFYNYFDEQQYNGYGAHWCIPLAYIFAYIEDTYSVKFYWQGGGFIGNIFSTDFVQKICIHTPDIVTDIESVGGVLYAWFDNLWKKLYLDKTSPYIYIKNNDLKYPEYKNVWDKADKTLMDLVQDFINYFNLIVDYIQVNGEDVIALRSFDDMDSFLNQNVVNFSGKIGKNWTYNALLPNVGGRNYIKFKNLHSGADEYAYSKLIDLEPYSIDNESDLLDIDAYIGTTVDWGNSEFVPNLSEDGAFKNFVFLYVNGLVTDKVKYNYNKKSGFNSEVYYSVSGSTGFDCPLAQYISLTNQYTLFESILKPLCFYEIEKYLTIHDISSLQFFNQHYIKEFGGAFFINKITGFNPDKSNSPTKLEIIRISGKMPDPLIGNLDYYCDGAGVFFCDGAGVFFI
jgi:hypothetical protein